MDTAVVKFGGTSLSTHENRALAISHIVKLRSGVRNTVAVVSAMGRKGAPYATDTLLSLINGENQATKDLLLSCGETISACVFADDLEKSGIQATAMTGARAGIVTDGAFGCAEIIDMDISSVNAAFREGRMPVITGFQGVSERGEVTTLGRGGSDTSAVVIGGFLNAENVYIFTDVPGIAAIDPRIEKNAPFLDEADFESIRLLAVWGAGVIHPRAVAAAQKYGADVWVRSTFDESPGTKLTKNARMRPGPVGVARLSGYGLSENRDGEETAAREGEVQFSLRPDANRALLTAVFYGMSEDEIKSMMGNNAAEARTFYSERCAHVLVDADKSEDTARGIYERLFG